MNELLDIKGSLCLENILSGIIMVSWCIFYAVPYVIIYNFDVSPSVIILVMTDIEIILSRGVIL